MRKKFAMLLALLLIAAALPLAAQARDFFNVPVTSDGITQKLQWETINIKNGKMVVKVSGFTEVKGKDFGLLSVIAQGEEIRAAHDIQMQRIFSRLFGMCVPYEIKHADRRRKQLIREIGKYREMLGIGGGET